MTETLLNYRLLLLIKPDVPEADFEAAVNQLRTQIEKDKGSVKEQDMWGLRDLAYRVKGYDKGYYAHLHFIATPQGLKNISSALALHESSLRYMLTRE